MSEETRHVRARLAVHDQLADVILVDWLSGLPEDLMVEFLENYTSSLSDEECAIKLRRLMKVCIKADEVRHERVLDRAGFPMDTRH